MAVISVLGPYVCPFSVSNTSVFSSNAVTVNRINKKKHVSVFYAINHFLLNGFHLQMLYLKTNLIKQTNLWVCVFLWRRSTMCHDL